VYLLIVYRVILGLCGVLGDGFWMEDVDVLLFVMFVVFGYKFGLEIGCIF